MDLQLHWHGTTTAGLVLLLTVIGATAAEPGVAVSPANAAQTAAANPRSVSPRVTCLPFQMPDPSVFLTGPRRVYAHYFNQFPLSIDNRTADKDYYQTQYLSPLGEGGKWKAQGGFLRSRPLPIAPSASSNYRLANLQEEVRMALARGIGGFTFDVLSLGDLKPGGNLDLMLQAASAVDPRFQVVLMLDAAAMGPNMAAYEQAIRTAQTYPGLARTADGRLIVSTFAAEFIPAQSWNSMLADLAADGVATAFYPTFLGLEQSQAQGYGSRAIGLGTFATALESEGTRIHTAAAATRAAHLAFMAGVPTQDYRPKDRLYWEAHGSSSFRSAWAAAIAEGADAVQLTTWNDFSESTQVEPYTDATGGAPGSGFYDLTGYFASWFVTGKPPVISEDAAYYFARRQPFAALGANDQAPLRNADPSHPGWDGYEIVSTLTAPGDIDVTIGSLVSHFHVPGGLSVQTLPLQPGNITITLHRGNSVSSLQVPRDLSGGPVLPDGYADLTYWSGGGPFTAQCPGVSP